MTAELQHTNAVGQPSLKFNKKLLLSQSKAAPVPDLLKRLKELHAEISHLDQENIDTSSLERITKELASPTLIAHRDKGVKAHVACCLADCLRLYAPDAPYSEGELRDIFEFFIRQLRNISDVGNPYQQYYCYLLESLSHVKSIVLVADLENGEDLINDIFTDFFERIRPDLSKSIRKCMTDILVQLTDECPSLPQEAFELVMAQFIEKRKAENPAAYKMACELCTAATDKLQRYVCQYFTDVIVAASRSENHLTVGEDLEQFRRAHDLIKELNAAAPGLLLNVIPQLEEELQVDDLNLRILATSVLGEMFAEKGSNLAARYVHVFKTWMNRRNDKHVSVRIAWVEHVLPIMSNHAHLVGEMNDALISKASDPEDKVRAAVCKAVGMLDFETALHHVDRALFEQVGHRCKDKKHGPRQEAIKALARLYALAYPEIVDEDVLAVKKFTWIPSILFNSLYVKETDITIALEAALHEYIFPPENDDAQRADRMLTIVSGLDEKARLAFRYYLQIITKGMQNVSQYLEICETYNGGTIIEGDEEEAKVKEKLEIISKRLSDDLAEPAKSYGHLIKFAQMHDVRCYKYLRDCMDASADYKTVKKAGSDALKRIENSVSALSETFTQIIRRISFTIVNKSLIPHLVRTVQSNRGERGSAPSEKANTANWLLKDISNVFPSLYKTHLPELNRMVQDTNEGSTGLQTLAQYAKTYPKDVPQDVKSAERFTEYALNGTPTVAKHAMIIMAHRSDGETLCSQIMEKMVPALSPTSPNLLTHLSALSQVVLYQPHAFEPHSDVVVGFIVKELIMQASDTDADDRAEWIEFDALDVAIKAKVFGLKVLINRLTAFAEDPDAAKLAKPVFKMLWKILECEGELLPHQKSSFAQKSHLRMAAALSLLKLAMSKAYEKMIGNREFRLLVMVAQDTVYNVRTRFVTKLVKYLGSLKLHTRYLTALPLVAHDPEDDIKEHVRSFLTRNSRSQSFRKGNASLFEDILPRFLHLLAHHPDFGREAEDLVVFSVYIEFFLDCIAHAENVSYLYHAATKLRAMRDADTPDLSENIYVLSDLTQLVIRDRSASVGWTLPSYPGDVDMPRELYKRLPNGSVSSEIMKRNYLPQSFLDSRLPKGRHVHHISDSNTAAQRTPRKAKKRKTQVPVTSPNLATRKSASRVAKPTISMKEEPGSDPSDVDESEVELEESARTPRRSRRRR